MSLPPPQSAGSPADPPPEEPAAPEVPAPPAGGPDDLEAIDRLEEPYRRVLDLRLRHRIAPVDIANILGVPPDTVRQQLHRGVERLRRADPDGAGARIALASLEPGDLGREPEPELEPAEPSATLPFVLGGLCTALALAALVLFGPCAIVEKAVGVQARSTTSRAIRGRVDPGVEAPRFAGAPSARDVVPMTASLRGTVIDGATGAPLEGATLSLYLARPTTRGELLQAARGDVTLDALGAPRSDAAWLRIPDGLPPSARLADGTFEMALPPRFGERHASRATTDARGAFELLSPAAGGLVRVEADGHGTRMLRFDPGSDEAERTVALWPERQVRGRVRDARGEPPRRPLTLRLVERSGAAVTASWPVETDAEGAFQSWIATGALEVECLTPGFALRAADGSATTAADPDTLELVATETPAAHVVLIDAWSDERLEDVRALCSADGVPWRNGRFPARDGRLDWDWPDGVQELELTVWTERHDPRRVTLTRDSGTREVTLERGMPSVFSGNALVDGVALAGASVRLHTRHPRDDRVDDATVVDAATTRASGHFGLRAPRGEYLLEVQGGERRAVVPVRVPDSAPVRVDLALSASLRARLVDDAGQPVGGRVLALSGPEGIRRRLTSDASGRVAAEGLTAGTYTATLEPLEGARGEPFRRVLQLEPGPAVETELQLPPPLPAARPRLRVGAAEGGFEGWRARPGGALADWEPVGPSGELPFAFDEEAARFLVEAPDGRRWSAALPENASGDTRIEIRLDGPAYEGVLRSRTTGAPLAGARVFARARDEVHAPVTSVATDAEGRFRLAGLSDAPQVLTFHTDADALAPAAEGNPVRRVRFLPALAPAEEAPQLDLRLPVDGEEPPLGLTLVSVSGRVLDAAGEPVAGARVSGLSRLQDADGALVSRPVPCAVTSDAEGRYAFELLGNGTLELSVRAPAAARCERPVQLGLAPGADRALWDFQLP